ncbi:AAA family ATPase [Aurantiacibacter luteus]|uniref:AAA family ATPase n=1 Tax=Aurantiacibacter luteus TaxID=1581420 RepID=UPI000699402F|nr:AAA family ATPase [Aurantiacibacter luteus]
MPLLGHVVLSGQATVVYAPPNRGKTLLMLHLVGEAVSEGTLNHSRTYVINADDSLEGVHSKRALLAERKVHMLVPGKMNFDSGRLVNIMRRMIALDQCRDVMIVVDTLKKFANLMDKRNASGFGNLVRQFALAGGTFFALAHTRKHEGADGNLVYTGTTDIVEDFDAACMLVPLAERGANGEKLVRFQFLKRRGANNEQTFAFDDQPDLSYEDRLSSVRLLHAAELRDQVTYEQYRQDGPIIEAIRSTVRRGTAKKMTLVKHVSEKVGASRQTVIEVFDRYTGRDPKVHQWHFEVKERGAKVIFLHNKPDEIEDVDD